MNPLRMLAKVAIIVAATVAVGACRSKPVVGVLLATSGTIGSYGQAMKQGCELALEEAEASGYPLPRAIKIGFKLESNVDRKVLIDRAKESLERNSCQVVVANLLQEVAGSMSHRATILTEWGEQREATDHWTIANHLEEAIIEAIKRHPPEAIYVSEPIAETGEMDFIL